MRIGKIVGTLETNLNGNSSVRLQLGKCQKNTKHLQTITVSLRSFLRRIIMIIRGIFFCGLDGLIFWFSIILWMGEIIYLIGKMIGMLLEVKKK